MVNQQEQFRARFNPGAKQETIDDPACTWKKTARERQYWKVEPG